MHALVLALALIASEQSYGPYTRPTLGADAAVAPARGGALVAWSEANRIHVGMLDAYARLGETTHVLPATTARAIALGPAAASNGRRFFVAWIELGVGAERVLGMFIDAVGSPLGAPRQYGQAVPVGTNEFTTRVVWDGAAYRLWASGDLLTIDTDGRVLASAFVGTMPHGVAARNGVIGTSRLNATLGCGFSLCSRSYSLVWTAGSATGSLLVWSSGAFGPSLQQPPISTSSIAAAEGRFAIAWASPNGLNYFFTGDGTSFVSASPETGIRPGIACDDSQCIIAYGQSGDVHAFAFPIDRLAGPELLTVAASERTERAPQVYALGPGRFLFLYRSDGADGARMSWRVVRFGPSRRRALH
jgi:hypothetical protein